MNLDVVVEGPGVVQYSEFRPEGMDWFPIEFYIDLDLVEPDYYWNNGLNSFTAQSVGPGYHRLRWLSEDDSDGNSVFLENLNFVSGDVVAFTMDHSAEDFGFGVAESSVEQGAVVKGQPITFTAIPGEHLEFLYWVIGEEIFRENPFEYRPQSDIHVEPYFGLRYQEAEYEVSADEFNNSPENPDFSVKIVDDVIELSASDFNGRIFLRRRNIERSHVLFEWQGKEGGSQYMQFYLDDVFRAHPHANVEPEDIVDGWTHFSHLTEFHDGSLPNSVMLACGLNTLVAGPSGLSIRNLRMASNLGLEVEPEGGGIVSDPDQSFFSLGSTVTIEAVPDEGNRFIGWGGSMDGHENPIQILVAPHTEIRAFFGKETVHDYDGISLVHDGSGQVNFGTHFHYNYWASVSGIPPGAQATLSTTIEGPAAVLFQSQDLSEVEVRVLVDGELAELKDVPFAFTPEYQLFIGAGPHVLTYEIINSDPFNEGIYEIRDFRLDPGWKVNIDAPGGDFVVLPEKENYEYGEMVHISAIAPERSRFLGWTGILEGENKYVSQLLNDHIVSTARFLRAVSFSGFDWESEETLPWDVNEFGLYCPDTNNIRYSGGASVSTEVVGPGTINIELGGGHISQHYSPRLEIWLDGEFVDAYQKDGSIIPEQYSVPLLAGQHTLEVRNVVYSLPNGAEVFEAGSIKSIAYEIEESDAARRSYLSQFISREALNSLGLESLKDDEDGDGIPFVLEQWLNSNPFSTDMQWPVELEASVDAEGNTCVYLESHLFSELYEGTFEVSGDLSTWFTVPSDEIVMDRISLNESVDLLKLKLPNTGNEPKVFLRVR